MISGIKIDYRNDYIMKERPSKNCTHCANGHYSSWPGSYDEPPGEDFDCDKGDVIHEDFFETGDMDAWPETCGHFDPYIIEKCGCCGQEMNVPEYLWPLVASFPGDEYAYPCSPGCLVILEAKEQERHRQRAEDERRYVESIQEGA